MNLVIHAQALKNDPLSQAITARFDERGGTIGRSDSNTLALPDPERHVSRLQAEVVFANGTFSIRNVGSANPITINGRPLQPGELIAIADGDQMVIGRYALRAELARAGGLQRSAANARTVIAASAGEPRTGPPPSANARRSATDPARREPGLEPPPPVDPFAGLSRIAGGPANPGDPFADLLGPAAAASPSAPSPTTMPQVRPASAAPARLPDDFDPFAAPTLAPGEAPPDALDDFLRGDRRPATPPPSAAPAAPDLLGAAAPPSSLDTLFGLGAGGSSQGDPLADFLSPPAAAGHAAAAPPPWPAAFDHTPELAGAYTPPAVQLPPVLRPAPQRPLAPPVASPVEPQRPDASTQALWAAFCEGAGIAPPLPQGPSPELMNLIGRLLHHAVEGTLKLSAVRTAAKKELRAPVTTIEAHGNNPLKFAVDPAAALAQLLQPPLRGFMDGPEAMHDAMDDLLGHSIATLAATRAALQGLLQQFEPAKLEARLARHGVLETLVPMARRARLWELYLEHHRSVETAAAEDFHQLFGRAFVQAYEEQIQRLAASHHVPAAPRR